MAIQWVKESRFTERRVDDGKEKEKTPPPRPRARATKKKHRRRRLALISLVEDGKPEYEFFPCKIEDNEEEAQVQADREELLLILTNSQRDKTDWEKMEEVRRLRAIMERNHQKGIRTKLAEALNASPASIGRLDAIAKHLIPEFQDEMREKRLGVSAAYELSGLPEEEQRRALEEYKEKNSFSVEAVRQKKGIPAEKKEATGVEEHKPPLPGQLYYDGVIHDPAEESEAIVSYPFPDGAMNQPEELSAVPLPLKMAKAQEAAPAKPDKVEVAPVAGQADWLEVHQNKQNTEDENNAHISSVMQESEEENDITRQIDAAIEALFEVSAKKGIDGAAFLLIMKALVFYKQEKGWDCE